MKIIYDGRQTGRTDALIKLCAQEEGMSYIVCSSVNEAKRILHRADELKLKIPFPITFREFLTTSSKSNKFIKHFYIDNADLLLQQLTTVPIEVISLEKKDEYCLHNGGLEEVWKRDSPHISHYKCSRCGDTFPVIGDTDAWGPKLISYESS